MIILNLKLNKLQKMLDVFELKDQNQPLAGAYRGRGWLMDGPNGRELILVGSSAGGVGFGLIGPER